MNWTDRLLSVSREARIAAKRAARRTVRPGPQLIEHIKHPREKHAALITAAADYSQSDDEWCKTIARNYIDQARDLRAKCPHAFTCIP